MAWMAQVQESGVQSTQELASALASLLEWMWVSVWVVAVDVDVGVDIGVGIASVRTRDVAR